MGKHLRRAYASGNPDQFAELLGKAESPDEVLSIVNDIPIELTSNVVARLTPDAATRLLSGLGDPILITWLDAGPTDTGRRLLSRFSRERADRLISGIKDASKRRGLRRLATYPSGSIGELVQIRVASVREEAIAADIQEAIQRFEGPLEGPVVVRKVDGTTAGVLNLKQFLQNRDSGATAADFCDPIKPVFAHLPVESLKQSIEWSQMASLPVVDHEQRLVGYITRQAVENATATDREASYVLESAIELSKRFWEFLAYVMVLILDRRAKP